MEDHDKRVKIIRRSSQHLLRVIDIQTDPGIEVQTEVAKVTHKQRSLTSSLRKKHSKLRKGLECYKQYTEMIEDLQKWIPEAQEKVEAELPVSSEPELVKKQLQEFKVIGNRNLLSFNFKLQIQNKESSFELIKGKVK